MSWFKDNVHIAAWLALPVMVIIALLQKGKVNASSGEKETFPLKKCLTYLLFLICFPLTLTPSVEFGTRFFCGAASIVLFGIIMSASAGDWAE